jgi:hypothetical protein
MLMSWALHVVPWAGSKSVSLFTRGPKVLAPITVCTCCEVMATAEFMMGSRRTCTRLTVRAKRESFCPTLRFVGNNRSLLRPCSTRQARHYEFDVDRHVVHTDQEKSNQLGTSIYFHGTAESCSRPSIMSYRKSNQKSRIIRSAPPKE